MSLTPRWNAIACRSEPPADAVVLATSGSTANHRVNGSAVWKATKAWKRNRGKKKEYVFTNGQAMAFENYAQFYFDYTFSNRSTLDWLASYKPEFGFYFTLRFQCSSNVKGVKTLQGFDELNNYFSNQRIEKKFLYGKDPALNTIGKLIETVSYDNNGVAVQRTRFSYNAEDQVARQRVDFHPTQSVLAVVAPAGMRTSVIDPPTPPRSITSWMRLGKP